MRCYGRLGSAEVGREILVEYIVIGGRSRRVLCGSIEGGAVLL
jgi:hypothetical protein